MTRVTILFLGLSLIISGGCKRLTEESGLKTLENLAAGDNITERGDEPCVGESDDFDEAEASLRDVKMLVDVEDAKTRARLGDEVAVNFSAVPTHYIDAFAALDGKVVVTPLSDTLCKFGTSGGDLADRFVTACNLAIQPGDLPFAPEFEGLTMVMAPDPGVIRRNTVRLTGQMFSQIFAQRLETDAADVSAQLSSDKFLKLELNLASAFLQDVHESGIFEVSTLEPMLGENAEKTLDETIPQFEKGTLKNPFERLATSDEAIQQFLTFVVADSFDSYHCAATDDHEFDASIASKVAAGETSLFPRLKNTRRLFEHFFPRTFARYPDVESYLSQVAQEIAALDNSTEAPSSSDEESDSDSESLEFSLAGEGGFWSSVGRGISQSLYVAKEAGRGALQGGANIVKGTYNAGAGVAKGVGSVVSTARNEGVGAAASKMGKTVKDHAHHSYDGMMKKADEIGAAYGRGDIGLGRASVGLVTEATSRTPIISNLGKSVNNTLKVATESDNTGKGLSYAEQTKISEKQGQVAGNAVVEAAAAKGAEAVGETAGAAVASGGQRAVAGFGAVAETVGRNPAALSGLGQSAAKGLTKTAVRLERSASTMHRAGVGHSFAGNVGSSAHVAANEGAVVPSLHGGGHNQGHGGGHSSHGRQPHH